jgi:hypothetical protein
MLAGAILAATITAMSAAGANAQQFQANLTGFQEVPSAIFSKTGEGTLKLKLDANAQSLTYTLTYSGLTSTVLQSHIHLGKVHVAGGIFLFLCTNLGNGPAGTPACPNPSATGLNAVTGTLTQASVLAVAGQNIVAGDFSIVPASLQSDTAYANVHTQNFPAGEIRGEIRQPEDQQDNQKK